MTITQKQDNNCDLKRIPVFLLEERNKTVYQWSTIELHKCYRSHKKLLGHPSREQYSCTTKKLPKSNSESRKPQCLKEPGKNDALANSQSGWKTATFTKGYWSVSSIWPHNYKSGEIRPCSKCSDPSFLFLVFLFSRGYQCSKILRVLTLQRVSTALNKLWTPL